MAFNKWSFIHLGHGEEDRPTTRAVIARGSLGHLGGSERSQGLMADGAWSIELCGPFGSQGVADIVPATGAGRRHATQEKQS